MALSNYSDLQTAIANWLARDGDGNLTPRIPDFIAMAEARIHYGTAGQMPSEPLRIRAMENTASLSTVAGTETVALPTGYLGMKRIKLISSPNIALQYLSPAMMDFEFPDSSVTGKPTNYTIEGENLRLGKIPDAVYSLDMLYYKKLDSLATASTNWLLTNYPNVYLYGALVEAAPFIGDDAKTMAWYGAFSSALNALNAQDSMDRHAGTGMAVRTDARVA